MFDGTGRSTVEITLLTDALAIEGRVESSGGSLLELLAAAGDFLLLEDARVDEHASRGNALVAPFVRVRVADVRLAVAELAPRTSVDVAPQTPVMLAIPPFAVTGRLGLVDRGEGIREVLAALPAGFVEVLAGAYSSEPMNISQRRFPVIVANTAYVQAMTPHRDIDPWAGLAQTRGSTTLEATAGVDGEGEEPGEELDDPAPFADDAPVAEQETTEAAP